MNSTLINKIPQEFWITETDDDGDEYYIINKDKLELSFREIMKKYCYNETKRQFYEKYGVYGFLQKAHWQKNDWFAYTYDLEEYKECCPNCNVFL